MSTWKDRFENNFFIILVGVAAVTIAAVFAFLSFFRGEISREVGLLVAPEVQKTIDQRGTIGRLKEEERAAEEAADAARRQETAARNAFAAAQTEANRARSLASELEARVQQITRLVDLSSFEERIDKALSDPKFRQEVGVRILPSGAVVAFDGSDCPKDWTPFVPAFGRMIVGVGPGVNLDEHGNPLTSRRSQVTGGVERVTLTEAQMPKHSHVQVWGQNEGRLGTRASGNDLKGLTGNPMQPTLQTGGSQAHNNMPPYIALYFCKKD